VSREVRWTVAARRDLLDIWSWRGRDRPDLGDLVVTRIHAACERLGDRPYLGPAAPQIAPDARKLTIDQYIAIYRVDEAAVRIVRVIDQRRLLSAVSFDET